MKSHRSISDIIKFSLVLAFSCAMIGLHFFRLFYNIFWCDTAFSVNLIRLPIAEMIKATASDVNPPFYYIFGKIILFLLPEAPATYRATAFIPYVGILILALTYVRKHFGYASAIIIIAFSSFSNSSIFYIMETRMYELGCFLALSMFLSLHYIFTASDKNRTKAWIIFYFTSILTAYTHYYLTVAVCITYLCLIVYCIRQRKDIRKCLTVSLIAILSYIPWIYEFLTNFTSGTDDWWAGGYGVFDETIKEIYGLKRFYIPSLALIAFMLIIRIVRVVKASQDNKEKEKMNLWFITTGVLIIFLTLGFGHLISILINPLFLSRYLYPLAGIGWLLLGIAITEICNWITSIVKRTRGNHFEIIFREYLPYTFSFLFSLIIVVSFWNVYKENITDQKEASAKTMQFINDIDIPNDSVIYSEIEAGKYTIAGCYFPYTKAYLTTKLYEDLPSSTEETFFLVLRDDNILSVKNDMSKYGYNLDVIKSGGNLGFESGITIAICNKQKQE